MDAEYKALRNKYRWYFAPHIAFGVMYWVFVLVRWLPSITDRYYYGIVIMISIFATVMSLLICAHIWEYNPCTRQYRELKRHHERQVLDKYYSTSSKKS